MLAQRTGLFANSGTANARAAAKEAAKAGREILDLTAGEILADLAPTLREGAIRAIDRGITRYSDTIGLTELREAIAVKVSRETGWRFTLNEVAVTTGAKQALFNAAMVLLDPGDEVLIPAPYWTTFPAQVLIAGGRPVFVETRANGYIPRAEDLRAAATPRTRAIVVNTPNNPTGAVYDRDTLSAIAQFAIERDLWVIFDECYSAFAYKPFIHDSILAVAPDLRKRLLIVNAFSKQLAITGWRVGYLVGPPEVIKAVKALQSHTTSNPNVIAQHAVLEHLTRGDGSYERQLFAQLQTARTRGLSILSSLERVPPPPAQGGFYFYLNVAAILGSHRNGEARDAADELVNTLLTRAGVAVVSGTAFGDPIGLRLSFGIPLDPLEKGLSRLVEAINQIQ